MPLVDAKDNTNNNQKTKKEAKAKTPMSDKDK